MLAASAPNLRLGQERACGHQQRHTRGGCLSISQTLLPLVCGHAGLSRLSELRFSACAMPAAPASLAGLPALRKLAFEACPVSGGGGMIGLFAPQLVLPPELARMPSLECLAFYGCTLRELPAVIGGMQVSA